MITSAPAVRSWTDAQGTSHNFLPNYNQRTALEYAGLTGLGSLGAMRDMITADRVNVGVGVYALLGLAAAIGNGIYGSRISGTGLGIGRGVLALLAPLSVTAYSLGQASVR